MNASGPFTDRSKKELGDIARRKGVRGWETMSKDQLIRTLSRGTSKPGAKPAATPVRSKKAAAVPTAKPAARATVRPPAKPIAKSAAKVTKPIKPAVPPSRPHANGTASHRASGRPTPAAPRPLPASQKAAPLPIKPIPGKATIPTAGKPAPKPAAAGRSLPAATPASAAKEPAAAKALPLGPTKDRVLLMVPDPYWLHAYWELTTQSMQRAEAALRQDWHGAKQVIRLFDVTSQDTTSTSETPIRDIFIHPGCNNWYIDVPQPPRTYRADIGYVSRRGDFFVLARSNQVTPPKAGSTEAIDVGWTDLDAKKAERILAMSTGFETADGDPELKRYLEERLRRPMGAPKDTAFGSGAVPPASMKKFFFELDAKLVVLGRTDPTAHVTLQNEPVKLAHDGTFVMWFSLPDSRQIIPAVATSVDGVEERTIVLAVERNTKHLDPMIHDQMNEP